MLSFLSIRVFRGMLTMFFVLVVAFLTVRLSGEPFQRMFPQGISQEAADALRREWLLDLPLLQQFMIYLGNVVRGDFGVSLYTGERVIEMYASRLPTTLVIGGLALLLAIVIGIPLGALSALRRGTLVERSAMSIAFLGYAMPHFVIGIGLVLVFGYHLRMLPTTGLATPQNYILPVATLATPMIAGIARFLRAAMLDAVTQAHVMAAASKGLGDMQIARRHILRNAMLPLLTLLGLEVAGLVNGSIFVEAVFSLPGVGRILVGAVEERDFAVLQFGVIAYAGIVVAISLAIDLCYTLADPRVRVDA